MTCACLCQPLTLPGCALPGRLTAPEAFRKVDAWGARLERSTASVGALQALLSGTLRGAADALGASPAPELGLEEMRRALARAGAAVRVALAAEADDELVALVRGGHAAAVLSNDSDFAVAEGCRWLPLSMLSFDDDAGAPSPSRPPGAVRGWLFEPSGVAAALGLSSVRQLVAASCLAGTDATGGLLRGRLTMAQLDGEAGSTSEPGATIIQRAAAWVASRAPLRSANGSANGSAHGDGCDDDGGAEACLAALPTLLGFSAADRSAWSDAVAAASRFYLIDPSASSSSSPPTPARASPPAHPAAWVEALPRGVRAAAAATSADALPSWALGALAHSRCWLPGLAYERAWGGDAGGGVSAAHAPLRRRMYAALGVVGAPAQIASQTQQQQQQGGGGGDAASGCERIDAVDGGGGGGQRFVREHGWDGAFWGSGCAAADAPVMDEAAAEALRGGVARLTRFSSWGANDGRPSCVWAPLAFLLADPNLEAPSDAEAAAAAAALSGAPEDESVDDPALRLHSPHEAWAALALRYMASLRSTSSAAIVARLSPAHFEACVASAAIFLHAAATAAAAPQPSGEGSSDGGSGGGGGGGEASNPSPTVRGPTWPPPGRVPPWRCVELSALLQSCLSSVYDATDVALYNAAAWGAIADQDADARARAAAAAAGDAAAHTEQRSEQSAHATGPAAPPVLFLRLAPGPAPSASAPAPSSLFNGTSFWPLLAAAEACADAEAAASAAERPAAAAARGRPVPWHTLRRRVTGATRLTRPAWWAEPQRSASGGGGASSEDEASDAAPPLLSPGARAVAARLLHASLCRLPPPSVLFASVAPQPAAEPSPLEAMLARWAGLAPGNGGASGSDTDENEARRFGGGDDEPERDGDDGEFFDGGRPVDFTGSGSMAKEPSARVKRTVESRLRLLMVAAKGNPGERELALAARPLLRAQDASGALAPAPATLRGARPLLRAYESSGALLAPPPPAPPAGPQQLHLPVDAHIPALLALVAAHAVVCISGETGCGKSTRVPLALLRAAEEAEAAAAAALAAALVRDDDTNGGEAAAAGGRLSRGSGGGGSAPARRLVIVTQPRRVAASSLAARVASQLGEPLGGRVGYAIGDERALGPTTRLLFVTTGWLLRAAAGDDEDAAASTYDDEAYGAAAENDEEPDGPDGGGSGAERRRAQQQQQTTLKRRRPPRRSRRGNALSLASHIVLDEAHDRSLDADFLSLLLKRRLAAARAAGEDVPSLVIMSATLQGELFATYFATPLSQAAADAAAADAAEAAAAAAEIEEGAAEAVAPPPPQPTPFLPPPVDDDAPALDTSHPPETDRAAAPSFLLAPSPSPLPAESDGDDAPPSPLPPGASAAPSLHVGSRRFPVREVYLDELSSGLGLSRGALLADAASEGADAAAAAKSQGRRPPRASRRLCDVAAQVAMHCAAPGSTVLMFLPGVAEIELVQARLRNYLISVSLSIQCWF